MSKCKNCDAEIRWKEPFVKGDRPLNLDDSVHSCKGHAKTNEPKSTVTPAQIMEECTAFKNAFEGLDHAKFESLAKIYISRNMSR